MKIEDNRDSGKRFFRVLDPGDVFSIGCRLYIKSVHDKDSGFNCILVPEWRLSFCGEDVATTPHSGTLVVDK